MVDAYGLDGEPISYDDWARLREDPSLWIVAKTDVFGDERCEVSTVWLGLDHAMGRRGPPLIYESLVFWSDRETSDMARYSTRSQALDGHAAIVARLRESREAVEGLGIEDQPAPPETSA